MKSKNLGVAALCLLVVGATGVVHATTYTLRELGPLPLGISSAAMGINKSGRVVGVNYTASTGRAVMWHHPDRPQDTAGWN